MDKCVQVHIRKCIKSELKVLKYNKRGYELVENYQCSICKEILVKRASKEIEHNGKKGRSSVEINKATSLSMFTSAISQANMTQFCSEVGIVHPEYSTLQRNNKSMKRDLMELSGEQLKKNRMEHVKFVRSQPGYEGDIEVFENGKDGKKIKLARGTIAIDGAGGTRAYNHLIKGSQHCQIVYSLDIKKPIMVLSDQISCYKCSRQLTKLMDEQKVKMNEVQYVNLEHKGKCAKNSKKSPAIAEEFACERVGKNLLLDKNNKFISENEAIFACEVVSDGDTRGTFRLILEQERILGKSVKGIAKPVPDIGHFIKCISNEFYKFKGLHKVYARTGMLEPLRIKSMTSDISKHLRKYNSKKKERTLILNI